MSLTSNYLDHLDGRLEKQGGRGSIARLLLVARKGDGADDSDAVVRYHERVRRIGFLGMKASPLCTSDCHVQPCRNLTLNVARWVSVSKSQDHGVRSSTPRLYDTRRPTRQALVLVSYADPTMIQQ